MIAALLDASGAFAQTVPAGAPLPAVIFARATDGKALLTERDAFVQRMSPFDRSSRMKSGNDPGAEAYLRFVAANVLDWNAADKRRVEAALTALRPQLAALGLSWPTPIYLIRTTGDEEGNAAYTRQNAIVLPSRQLNIAPQALQALIAHELFHVLSRSNPALREKLYAAIGFFPCGELRVPPRLRVLEITNPDAPVNDSCILLRLDRNPVWAIPLVYATAAYDEKRGGDFFDYMQFHLLLLPSSPASPSSAGYDRDNPRLVEVGAVAGFYEQVGRNTDYIIHPEEILADNFALLVRGAAGVRSPEVLRKLRTILDAARRQQ